MTQGIGFKVENNFGIQPLGGFQGFGRARAFQ